MSIRWMFYMENFNLFWGEYVILVFPSSAHDSPSWVVVQILNQLRIGAD